MEKEGRQRGGNEKRETVKEDMKKKRKGKKRGELGKE